MIALLAALVMGAQVNSATNPAPRDNSGWMFRHKAMVSEARKGTAQIVFIGDSITHAFGGDPDTGDSFKNRGADTWNLFYGDDHPLNLGISGDRTQHVLWRLDNGEFGATNPKVAVVMIGTNNVSSNTAPEIASGVEAVCDRVHALSPTTKVLLLAVFPRGTAQSPERKRVNEVNAILSRFRPEYDLTYLDIGYAFLGKDGDLPKEVMPDLLHPFAYGYRKWAMAMEPTLAKLMGRPPKCTDDPKNTAVVPVSQNLGNPSPGWRDRMKAVDEFASRHPTRLAFIGASINEFFGGPPLSHGQSQFGTVWEQYYAKRDAIDLGFSGDRTENVIWRLEQGEIDDMPLEAVSIMVGTNNIGINSPRQIAEGIKRIVDLVHSKKPRCKILLLGLFPTGELASDPKRKAVKEVNETLMRIVRSQNVTFMDIGARFLSKDGSISRDIMADFLHPTEKGYRIWAETVEPWMQAKLDRTEP